MANFKKAEKKTGTNEGFYANNPADKGGETWMGIARNHWPKWTGWKILDNIKRTYGSATSVINKYGKADTKLMELTSQFYKTNFWDKMKLDALQDQQLAGNVYDFGVNSGDVRAVKFLQESINETGLIKVSVDGKMGPETLNAANKINANWLHAIYNKKREAYYRSIAKGDQAQFLASWLSRISNYIN